MKIFMVLMNIGLFLLICAGTAGGQIKDESKKMVKIFLDKRQDINRLDGMDLDFASRAIGDHAVVYAADTELHEIIKLGFKTEIVAASNAATAIDSEYHRYEEVLALLDSLAAEFPHITKLDTIGTSQRYGRYIQAIKISDNPEIEEDEPAVLYDGQHHAREPVGMECCLAVLDFLLHNYGKDQQVTNWVDSTEIWIVPMLNPDGWVYMTESGLADVSWRKNQRDNNSNGLFDADYDGVDLNRNYDFHWNEGGNVNPRSSRYRGPEPFSESEIRGKRDLAHAQKFVLSLTYHSRGEYLIYPWELDGKTAPDQSLIIEIADSVASRIPTLDRSGYYGFYDGNGNGGYSDVWMYGTQGTIEYTVETAPVSIPSGQDALTIAQDNVYGALYLLDRVKGPGITGHITNAETGQPLSAVIKILEIYSPVLTPRTSDAGYGRYFRLLQPGTYTVEVSKKNYNTVTLQNIHVSDGKLTRLDFQLDSSAVSIAENAGSGSAVLNSFKLLQNYPNPFNPKTVISYQLPAFSNVDLSIYNLQGKKVAALVNKRQAPGSYKIIWDGKDESGREVSSGNYFCRITAFGVTQTRKMVLIR